MIRRLSNILVAATMMLAAATAAHASAESDAKAFRDITLTPRSIPANEANGELREDAKEVAEVLDITNLVDRLRREKANYGNSREIQNIRLTCLWKLFTASEEVRQVVNECDYDLAQAQIALDGLMSKKQMMFFTLSTANFIQLGTLGIIKNVMGFSEVYHVAEREVAMAQFGTSIALAETNQLIGPTWSRKIDSRPTMLSHFFYENFKPKDNEVSYLWKFFNKPCPGFPDNLTRRQVLVRHWKDFGGMDIDNAKTVGKVTANITDVERENIKMLKKRVALLHDLQSHFEEFDASLYELHKAITN